MYDFLLFENYHQAQNHKFDMILIARMMKSQGMNVAIFDIYHEDKDDEIEGIPVVHWVSKNKIPDDTWMLRKHSIFETLYKSQLLSLQNHKYMKEVKNFIIDKAENFYCGSYHNGMSTILFDIKKPCYWWGLRSDRFRISTKKFFPYIHSGLHLLKERRKFISNKCQRLFVSNDIILEEHVRLGISRDRMIIREERCIDKISESHYEKLNSKFTFLTIGQLRPDKRVDFVINEFSKLENDCRYIIAGKSLTEYEDVIQKNINDKSNIERINKFLDYSDFNELFFKSHFVILADKRQNGCVTNGTMVESFINHRPIIAPNYDPYKLYVEKFNVGVLYNPDIPGSLEDAMKVAMSKGCAYYEKNINLFLSTILFDNLSKKFVENIRKQSL